MASANFKISSRKDSAGNMVVIDNASFNRAFRKLKNDTGQAMWEAAGKTLSDAKEHTYRYLKGFEGMYPGLATKVANSLAYDRGGRGDVYGGDNPQVDAIFGSRGPSGRSGEIGAGVHTDPDDTDGTYNIGAAFNSDEFGNPGTYRWKNKTSRGEHGGAIVHGRQVGTMSGNSPWYGVGGSSYFYGYANLDYIGEGMRKFAAKIEGRLNSNMKKRLS
tara:strand:- start:261 stop:911 length:651 start_codon:yes stop_codon:yes gene_type:complete